MDKIRFTMDMDSQLHRGLKAFTAINALSMKEYITKLIEVDLEKNHICPYGYEHTPNDETINAMKDEKAVFCKSIKDIWD